MPHYTLTLSGRATLALILWEDQVGINEIYFCTVYT
jgi:hypothetical protein